MVGFIAGLMIGGFLGVFVMALMSAASQEDEQISRHFSNKEL